MQSLIGLVSTIIGLYVWFIIAYAVIGLLFSFNILNPHSDIAHRIYGFLNQMVEPALRPLRRIIPMFGTVDITPLVLILGLNFLQSLIHEYAFKLLS